VELDPTCKKEIEFNQFPIKRKKALGRRPIINNLVGKKIGRKAKFKEG